MKKLLIILSIFALVFLIAGTIIYIFLRGIFSSYTSPKKTKKVFTVLISLIIFCIYFKHTSMPMYAGRFTIDINNTTFKTIDGATLEYESANKVITLPKIKPMERLIIIAPTEIYPTSR